MHICLSFGDVVSSVVIVAAGEMNLTVLLAVLCTAGAGLPV